MPCGWEGNPTVGLVSHWPRITDISGSPPTGSRPRRGRWAPAYAVLVEYGELYPTQHAHRYWLMYRYQIYNDDGWLLIVKLLQCHMFITSSSGRSDQYSVNAWLNKKVLNLDLKKWQGVADENCLWQWVPDSAENWKAHLEKCPGPAVG